MKDLLNKLMQDKKIIILIIAVSSAIFYLDFAVILKAQLAGIKNTGPQITKLKQDLETLAKDLKKMQDSENERRDKEKTLLKVKKFISEDEIVALLDDISDTAEKYKVVISQMKHPRQSQALRQDKSNAAVKTSPLLINIDLSADYHALGKFINDLENLPVFLAVENMKITSHGSDYLRQKVTLGLRTYVRK